MTKQFVSVIVPRSRPSVPCVESLLGQDYPKDKFEVLIVSHKKFGDDIEASKDKRVKPLFVKENSAIIKRNIGAKKAEGELLFFIDDDAIPDKNWISKTVQLFEETKADVVAGPNIGFPDQSFAEEVSDILIRNNVGSYGRKKFKKGAEGFASPKDFSTCNLAIKKSVFLGLGGLDIELGFHGEDTVLLFRAVRKGFKLYYSPELAVIHRRKEFPRQHLRQLFNWGYGNGSKAVRKKSMFTIPDITLPPLILFGLAVLGAWLPTGSFGLLLAAGFGLIFALTLVQENLRAAIIFSVTFPLHYLSYTFGLIYGMLSAAAGKDLRG